MVGGEEKGVREKSERRERRVNRGMRKRGREKVLEG